MKRTFALALFVGVSIWVVLSSRSGGLATMAGIDRTGRVWQTCNSCHAGGNFSPSVNIEILENGVPINAYKPNTNYVLRVTYSSSTGSPAGFGSQTTLSTISSSGPFPGTFGNVLSGNTQISSITSRDYLEHSGISSSGVFEVEWTSPAAGTGNVRIYSAGVAVDGNGSTAGDDATSTNLILPEFVCQTINPNISKVDASAPGASDGSITITPGSGYTWLWSTGATSFSINNLSAGIYGLTISDANACTDTFEIRVFEPPLVSGGYLDTNFQNAGIRAHTLDLGNSVPNAQDVVLSDSSTMVILGDEHLIFMDTLGNIDSSYGLNGIIQISAIEPSAMEKFNNKIYIAGQNIARDVVVQRRNLDGTPDSTYGINSLGVAGITQDIRIYAMTIDFQGRVIAVGKTETNPDNNLVACRWTVDGNIDSTFANNGFRVLIPGNSNDELYGVAMQSDGKIIISGETYQAFNRVLVARLDTNGNQDMSFGTNGYFQRSIIGRMTWNTGVVVNENDEIYTYGVFDNTTVEVPYIIKLTPNGIMDPSWAGNGELQIPTILRRVNHVVLQSDGKLLLGGHRFFFPQRGNFAALRFLPDATPDSTWNGTGVTTTDFFTRDDFLRRLVILPSNNVIGFGPVRNVAGDRFLGVIKYGNSIPCATEVIDTNFTFCQGDSVFLLDQWHTQAKQLLDTITDTTGCDTIFRYNLNLLPSYIINVYDSIYPGQTFFSPSGKSIDSTGTLTDSLQSVNGCDSTVNYNIGLIPVCYDTIVQQICANNNFLSPSGILISSDTSFSDTLKTANCDSIFQIQIQTLSVFQTLDTVILCLGDSHLLPSGNYAMQVGIYNDTLTTINGCDSVVITQLNVAPTYDSLIAVETCQNFYLTSFGDTVFGDTSIVYSLNSAENCDSIFRYNIIFSNQLQTFNFDTLCAGDFYMLPSGDTVFSTGIFTDTLNSIENCDSVVVSDVFFRSPILQQLSLSICPSDSILLPGGEWANSVGIYLDTLISVNLCDSIIETNIQYHPTQFSQQNASICAGDNYLLPGGALVANSGTYRDTFPNTFGCDSVIETQLLVRNPIFTQLQLDLCTGDSLRLPGGDFTSQAGIYLDTLTSVTNCDSVIETTVIQVAGYFIQQNLDICLGDSVFLPGGYYVNSAGTFIDTLMPISTQCDSVVESVVNILQPTFTSIQLSFCDGDSVQLPSGNWTVSTGIFTDTLLSSITACDSVVESTVSSVPLLQSSRQITICQGDSFQLFNGNFVRISGFYNDTLTAITTNCDSIVTTEVVITPPQISKDTMSICFGDSIQIFGIYQSTSGVYLDTIPNRNGCDSVLETSLIILPQINTTDELYLCPLDSILLVNGQTVNAAGTYPILLQSVDGCDSSVTLTVVAADTFRQHIMDTVCAGETYTLPSGKLVGDSGIFVDTLSSIFGCDSLIEVHLSPRFISGLEVQLLITVQGGISGIQVAADTSISSIRWLECSDNFAFTGVRDQLFFPILPAEYAAEVTQFGCVDTSECLFVNPVSTNDIIYNNTFNVKVFPNPTNGLLHFEVLESSTQFNTLDIALIDLKGSKVLSKTIGNQINENQLHSIDLSNLRSGIYFMSLSNQEKVIYQKIILQR